jgi:predicted RNase H-like HicB family nuclease
MRHAIVIEKACGNYAAYVPDLPGCVATGETVGVVRDEIRDATRFHIEGLQADGIAVPEPTRNISRCERLLALSISPVKFERCVERLL